MTPCDLLISGGWLVCVNPQNEVLQNASVVVIDGRIEAILPTAEAKRRYAPSTHVERSDHILMPGLINAHTHLAMNLFRGMADDLPLETWLEKHIWPAEQRAMSPEFVKLGTRLALAESIRSGVTCVNDMYFFPDQVSDCLDETGMRGMVGMLVIDFASAWAADATAYFKKGIDLHDRMRSHPRITTAFAPHSTYAVSEVHLQKIAVLATEMDVPVHIHLHETATEIQRSMEQHGKRPLAVIEDCGLLTPSLIAIHMTQLEKTEITKLAEHGVSVVHCPESNMKLASGTAPVAELLAHGCNVALGTDGAASNNDLDMLGEMRTAGLLGKLASNNAAACDATSLLRQATINGAQALGIDAITGSLEPGKAADVIAISTDAPEMQPIHNVCSTLAYSTSRHSVSDVWVDGKCLMQSGALTTLDSQSIVSDTRQWLKDNAN